MNATICSTVAPPTSATVMPPSAPPANISRTRSRLTTSPAANRPAAISQSNHGAMIEVSHPAPDRWSSSAPAGRYRNGHASRRSLAGCTISPPAGSRSGRPPGSPAARPTTTPSTPCSATPRTGSRACPGTDGGRPAGRGALARCEGWASSGSGSCCRCPATSAGCRRCPGLAPLALESGQAAVGERLALVPEALGPGGGRSGRRSRWTAPRPSRRPVEGSCAPCPGSSTSRSATPPARSRGSTWRAGTRRCPRCWPGWADATAPALPATTTRWPCRCWAARSGCGRPRPGPGRRPGCGGQPRAGRPPRRGPAPARRRGPRRDHRRVQLGPPSGSPSAVGLAVRRHDRADDDEPVDPRRRAPRPGRG